MNVNEYVLLFWRDFCRWLHWRLPFWQYPLQPAAATASEQTSFRSVINMINLWAFDEFTHLDNWIVYPYSILVLWYHWLVYFGLILFYFLVFYLDHYSYQDYCYCEFYIVFTIIFNVLLPVCFRYHYLVPLFICIYVYLFIYLFIESRGLVTFWC